jgi:uncharacterized protein (DUF952 family)
MTSSRPSRCRRPEGTASYGMPQPDEQRTDRQPIYHAALPQDWAAAFESGQYTISTRWRTLADEGFIHTSTLAQVEGVANRFYADVDELVLLTIDQSRVGAEIKWESPAPGIDELFPHIYGPLPIVAVVATAFWTRTIDGEGAGWSLDRL